jgi:hypothetical protein
MVLAPHVLHPMLNSSTVAKATEELAGVHRIGAILVWTFRIIYHVPL